MGCCRLSISLLFLLLITFFSKGNTSKEVLARVTSLQVSSRVADALFVVFDGTGNREKPDLTKFGLESIHIIYSSRFLKNFTDELIGTMHLLFDKLLEKRFGPLHL